jgi:hypothetical protein
MKPNYIPRLYESNKYVYMGTTLRRCQCLDYIAARGRITNRNHEQPQLR